MGRFDQSFFMRMVVSFMALTAGVAAVELSVRFALVFYRFHEQAADDAQIAAERLADDVRSIMLNQGGPVASRTVYPILQRTLRRNGTEIAIEPATVTRTSIAKAFGFEPHGVPSAWPQGTYREARVDLHAAEFCLRCHVDARVGDVLGTVTTRRYLRRNVAAWWEDVRLTGAINLVTIVVHSVILFFLLRTLLAPLLSLRTAVSQLAKGAAVSTRAEIRSSDEFGELANDLNAFLDRVGHILKDLERTIAKMVAVNARLAQVTGRTREQLAAVDRALQGVLPVAFPADRATGPFLVADLTGLDRVLEGLEAGRDLAADIDRHQLSELRQSVHEFRAEWERSLRLMATMPQVVREVHELRHLVDEIGFLDEHLTDVAEAGRQLLERLLQTPAEVTAIPQAWGDAEPDPASATSH
jgi:HAMP domain-containing protein